MKIDTSQINAIRHKDGPELVLAGPGSGKTLVITRRVQHLIDQYHVPPSAILVITFTKAAATEMRQRFEKLMGGRRVPVSFGTFHAVYFMILKHAYGYTADNIVKEEQRLQFMKEYIRRLRLEYDDENEFISSLFSEISLIKNTSVNLAHYYSSCCGQDVFRNIFEAYENFLHQNRFIDFDDMLVYCKELLVQRPDILAAWQRKYQYILIDEFQDINRIQYQTVKLLLGKEHNIFAVGDDDQSVYGFRGADTRIMLGFPDDFPDTRMVCLSINYRCSSAIVESAGRIIKNNKKRYQKEIRSAFEKSQCERVHVIEVEGMRQETDGIIQKIREMNQQGIPYLDIAILYRTNSEPSGLAMKLMQNNIPFRMKDNMPDLFSHFVVVNILDYIKAALGNRERALFLRIINRPNRYISRECLETDPVDLERMQEFYKDNHRIVQNLVTLETDFRRIAELKPYAAVNYIRKAVGYDEYLKEYASYRGIDPQEYMDIADEFQEMARGADSFIEWFNLLNEYRIKLKEQGKTAEHAKDAVVLATMHGAKGLEFDQVFIMNAVEGMTPHKKSVTDAELEEERRMFYVAVTRARYGLYIYVPKVVYGKTGQISRFVTEMVIDYDMLQVGNKIIHKRYGKGVITFVDDKKICVYFEKDQITKTLSIEYTIKNNLVTVSEDD